MEAALAENRENMVERAAEYVCDNLCKYAATKGKSQQWLDKVCGRCKLSGLLTELGR